MIKHPHEFWMSMSGMFGFENSSYNHKDPTIVMGCDVCHSIIILRIPYIDSNKLRAEADKHRDSMMSRFKRCYSANCHNEIVKRVMKS